MTGLLLLGASACALAAACAPAGTAPTLTVKVDARELPADGTTPALVHVALDPPRDDVVVKLSTGLGALAQTSVALTDGRAATTLWPPNESELGALPALEVELTAEVLLEEGTAPLVATARYRATPPADGDPLLVLSADPQRVRADGATPLTVHVSGRRIAPGTVVVLTTDAEVGAPADVVLDADAQATFDIPARATPASFVLTAAAPGAPAATLALAFLGDDAPSYDLTGTFAQVTYGVVEISGVGISPSPQLVAAPTLSKVTITQGPDGIETVFETCDVKMPIVCIAILGDPEPSTTTPSSGFLASIPPARVSAPVRGRDTGARFEPDASAFEAPMVIGADLEDPNDPLPDSESDARVNDADNDGAPGVTMRNSSLDNDQHVVIRMRTEHMSGVITSSDEIDGSAPGSTVGGTDTAILNADFLTSMFSPVVTGQPSTFKMVRVDGRTGGINIAGNDGVPEDISCADVRQYLANPSTVLESPVAAGSCLE